MNRSATPHTFAAHWPKIQLVEAPTRSIVRHTKERIAVIRQADITTIQPIWQKGTIALQERHTMALEQTIAYLQSKIHSRIDHIGIQWISNMLRNVHPEVDISYTLQMMTEAITIGYARSLTYEDRQVYQWTDMPNTSVLALPLPTEPSDYAIQKISTDMICQVYTRMFPVAST